MSMKQTINFINTCNRNQLTLLASALKERSKSLSIENSASFQIGDKVSFTHKYQTKKGIVEGYNRTHTAIKVNVEGIHWTVSPSLLKKK